jgi:hypothetical protein
VENRLPFGGCACEVAGVVADAPNRPPPGAGADAVAPNRLLAGALVVVAVVPKRLVFAGAEVPVVVPNKLVPDEDVVAAGVMRLKSDMLAVCWVFDVGSREEKVNGKEEEVSEFYTMPT